MILEVPGFEKTDFPVRFWIREPLEKKAFQPPHVFPLM
jgi:hypothetical protein